MSNREEIREGMFLLGTELFRFESIKYLELSGGASGFGCWGKIQFDGDSSPLVIGDGSYANDIRHVNHRVARKPNGESDFNFTILRAFMGNTVYEPLVKE